MMRVETDTFLTSFLPPSYKTHTPDKNTEKMQEQIGLGQTATTQKSMIGKIEQLTSLLGLQKWPWSSRQTLALLLQHVVHFIHHFLDEPLDVLRRPAVMTSPLLLLRL